MPSFQSLRTTLGYYLSPPTRKSRTGSTTPSQRRIRFEQERMSPTKRTSDWLRKTQTQLNTPRRLSLFGVIGNRITKPPLTPKYRRKSTSVTRSRRRSWGLRLLSALFNKRESDETGDDNDGTTVVGSRSDPSPGPRNNSPTVLNNDGDSDDSESDGDDVDVYRGWTDDEVWLFEKLNWRGFEPLLPQAWEADFQTMYDALFTEDMDVAFIKSAIGRDYYGKLLLYHLPFCTRI